MAMQSKNRREADEAAVELIRHWSEPLPEPEPKLDNAFGAAFDRFGAARVVLLGEATHGSSEFYRARAAITRRLIERHGFSIVAVEADWPDAATIDAAVGHRGRTAGLEADAFTSFPTWMWRNAEIEAFTQWLREHNAGLQSEQRVEFRGLDLYSLGSSIRAVLRFLAGGGSMHDTPVSTIMKIDVLTVGVETRTIDAMMLMRKYRYGCVPVIQDGHLVGILTNEDLMNVASKLLERELGEAKP